MNNEPVGYVYSVAGEPIKSAKINPEIPNGTPLYTHPHPDNLGLALSIIDQQKLEIERLKAKTLTDEDGVVNESAEFTIEQWNLLKKASEK